MYKVANPLYRVLLVSLLGCLVLQAEPSVYGFDTQSKAVSENKKAIASLRQQVAMQKERINGLTTLVEGLSASVSELQQRSSTATADDQSTLLKELRRMIDNINENYVSKEQLQKILSQARIPAKTVPQKRDIKKKDTKKRQETHSVQTLAQKRASQLYSQGVRLFQKKRFDEAKKRFEITDARGYKAAPTNYYLGEIAYYTKHYKDAIFYFKKSAGLYDRAGYIDTLLLHTAIALEKTGDKKQAKRFYENIVANYPGRKTAQIAQRNLARL